MTTRSPKIVLKQFYVLSKKNLKLGNLQKDLVLDEISIRKLCNYRRKILHESSNTPQANLEQFAVLISAYEAGTH